MSIIQLKTYSFPEYANHYYGDDVQTYWFEREGNEYRIMQRPHYFAERCIARVIALNVEDAKRQLFAFCERGETA